MYTRRSSAAACTSVGWTPPAILLISSELPDVLNLSTRILVLRQGRLMGELPRADADQESLMRLMAGVAQSSAA